MKYFYWLFVLLAAAVLAAFCVSNRDAMTLSFWPLPYTVTIPLYLAVIIPLVFGLVVGRLFGYLAGVGVRHERARLRVRVRELERDLTNQRTPPVNSTSLSVRQTA